MWIPELKGRVGCWAVQLTAKSYRCLACRFICWPSGHSVAEWLRDAGNCWAVQIPANRIVSSRVALFAGLHRQAVVEWLHGAEELLRGAIHSNVIVSLRVVLRLIVDGQALCRTVASRCGQPLRGAIHSRSSRRFVCRFVRWFSRYAVAEWPSDA